MRRRRACGLRGGPGKALGRLLEVAVLTWVGDLGVGTGEVDLGDVIAEVRRRS
jgi:hypothetical protein